MTTPNTLNSNIANRVSFLRTTREFPEELHQLSVECNRSYRDIASSVNSRTIGLFSINRSAITGEEWFLDMGQKRQTLRQVFLFTTTAPITHNIQVTDPAQFVRCFGVYTDGTNSFGLIYGSNVAIAGQISFFVSPTQIIFLVGAGAPALSSTVNSKVVLEWLSSV